MTSNMDCLQGSWKTWEQLMICECELGNILTTTFTYAVWLRNTFPPCVWYCKTLATNITHKKVDYIQMRREKMEWWPWASTCIYIRDEQQLKKISIEGIQIKEVNPTHASKSRNWTRPPWSLCIPLYTHHFSFPATQASIVSGHQFF